MKLRLLILAVVIMCSFAGSTNAQESEKPANPLQYPLVKFEAAPQLGCPVELTVVGVSNRGPEAMLRLKNVGTKAIKVHTIVINADPRSYLWTSIIEPIRLQPGQSHSEPVTIIFPNQNKGGVATVSLDYIEFSDGTTWGSDVFGKSKDVAKYREGRKVAIANLMRLLRGTDAADFTHELDLQPGARYGEPVLTPDELSHKVDYTNKGYQSVILMLDHMKTHVDEAIDLAKKLQEMQKASTP